MARTICKHRPGGILEYAPCAECTGEENNQLRAVIACLVIEQGGRVVISSNTMKDLAYREVTLYVDPDTGGTGVMIH